MGFDVLAWESGFFDCEEMNKAINSDVPALQAAQRDVFSIWTLGGVMTPLFDCTRTRLKTDRPLHHTGFDIQFSSPNSGFIDVVNGWDKEILSDADKQMVADAVRAINTQTHKPGKDEEAAIQAAVSRIAEALRKQAAESTDSRRMQFLAKPFENFWHVKSCPINTIGTAST